MSLPGLGIDISKHKFHAALLLENSKVKPKALPNTAQGHQELISWLHKQGGERVHACMEATSTYGEALAQVLVDAGHMVSIVNPSRSKGFARSEMTRTKTDKIDAAVIARFCAALRPTPWHPPTLELKQLRVLVRRLEALQQMYYQEQNRLESADAIVNDSIAAHLDYLQQEINKTKQQIHDHFEQYSSLKSQKNLLVSIPGIAEQTAAALLAELQSWQVYENARQLAAYSGLTPQERTSGSSVRGKAQISRLGNKRLRKALYMPAIVARYHNPIIRTFCERLLERGKTKMQVVGAAMRKLLHMVYGILKSQKPFDPNFISAPS